MGSDLIFPAALYDHPKTAITKDQVIPLSPKEAQILYKGFWYGVLRDRQKDMFDLRTYLPTLDREELGRMIGYFQTIVTSLTNTIQPQ